MRIKHRLSIIDGHTAGEPTRMILSGYPKVPGATLADRMAHLRDHLDWVRRVAMNEPRGHRDMFGCILMEPIHPEADIAAIYMDGGQYYNMCGHASLGVAAMLVEIGRVLPQDGQAEVCIETPAGLVHATVTVDATGDIQQVSLIDVPSYAAALDRAIDVPGYGTVRVDVGYGGNFFAIASAADLGFADVGPGQTEDLIRAGVALRAAARGQITVQHPTQAHINTIDLAMLTGPPTATADARSIVILGEAQADRSPCGTGTCARMAVMAAKGELVVGQTFRHQSSIETVFDAVIVATTDLAGRPAIVPRIACRPYLTGFSELVVQNGDMLGYGFTL
jgi:proline racemase